MHWQADSLTLHEGWICYEPLYFPGLDPLPHVLLPHFEQTKHLYSYLYQ